MSTLGVSADGAINTARKNTADGNIQFGASMPDNPFASPSKSNAEPERRPQQPAPAQQARPFVKQSASSSENTDAQREGVPAGHEGQSHAAQNAPSEAAVPKRQAAAPAPVSEPKKEAPKQETARKVLGGGAARQILSAEKTRDGDIAYTRVKDVPVALVNLAKQSFPYAKNQTDALVAYVVSVGGSDAAARMRPYLTPVQQEMVDGRRKEPNERLEEKLDHVISLLRDIRSSEDVVKLLSVFSVFDRFGFRRENPGTPRDANLLESGVSDMFTRAEEQARQYKSRLDNQKGWSKG